ncbi:MAG: glycosyltransferase [Muribaculaceae bacterium]|nr:glycosyltransferase [Muribaculaceae bacterium]
MEARPLISIITITFNAAETLPLTLKSIAEQTFADFEHLVIDGASTDDTILVARRMGRPGVRIVSEPDKGLYDAMNKGLRLAKGSYVLFLNSGDRFHAPDSLEAYARAIRKSLPDIIYGDTDIVDDSGQRLGPRHLSAPEILTFESFSHGMLVCHQAFMVRKEIAPFYDTDYRFSADYDWTIRCIRASRPGSRVNLHRVTIDYLSDGLTDKNKKASLMERFRIMAEHYGTMKTIGRHLGFIPRMLRRGKL